MNNIIKIKSSDIFLNNYTLNKNIKLYDKTNGTLLFVVGKHGTGKTKLLLKLAKVVLNPKLNILYISLDKTKQEFESENTIIKNDNFLTIYISASTSIEDIEEFIRATGTGNIVIIDYIQLINTNSKEDRAGAIDLSVDKLKSLKEELGVTIFVSSQLGESLEINPKYIENADSIILIEE